MLRYAALCTLLLLTGLIFALPNLKSIQNQLAEIRGLRFKQPVAMARSTNAKFTVYVKDLLKKQISERKSRTFGKVIKRLGLYKGPEIKNYRALLSTAVAAAGYYDPDKKIFYLIDENTSSQNRDWVIAHELVHSLQDQHFFLNDFLLSPANDSRLSHDELLARRSIIEGEASYIAHLWQYKNNQKLRPSQSELIRKIDQEAMAMVLSYGRMADLQKQTNAWLDITGSKKYKSPDIPDFLIAMGIGAYAKGMQFVARIHKEKNYNLNRLFIRPPISTEQILHYKKYLGNEKPAEVHFNPTRPAVLRDFSLLDTDILGELLIRSIFAEQGLGKIAARAADGWHGDRYAVFLHRKTQKTLLLFFTNWDTHQESQQFLQAYKALLHKKYKSNENTGLKQLGNSVLIIEGGDKQHYPKLFKYLASFKK